MEIISLSGQWQVKQSATPNAEWLAASVPGCIHTDLIAAGVIHDPFYRDYEKQVLWVGEEDWDYRRTFSVQAELLTYDRLLLRCHGLDTLATISLNGSDVGQTDNMFRIWEYDVRPLLKPGDNEIAIRFESALRVGQEKLNARYIHNWSTDTHKLPGGNYVRKAQCHFGWDWGPRLVTCGIWREIELVAYNTGRLADVHVLQDHSKTGAVQLNCRVAVERLSTEALNAECRLIFAGKEIERQTVVIAGESAEVNMVVNDPQLWWPNGLGEQPLYTLAVTLSDEAGAQLDSKQLTIGLRTLKLVRQADEWGETFKFACNGRPFFAKGANWIPADSFVTRLSEGHYAQLLQAAADVHMNMLRVWGGGIYESSIFYELCDQLGICVWQDFMFSCATYPTYDEAYMKNVEEEAIDNIRRLRHHASMALWCGNNELEQGLVQDKWTKYAMSWDDYGELFDRLLPRLVAELDPETDYWPSSPHTPLKDRNYWNDPRSGDAHIWDVWHGMQPFEYYFTCFHRFNSEFGFQSFPEPKTIRTFTEAEDKNINSYVMEFHQRSPSGNSKIMHYLLDWFRLPGSFNMTLWLSQILQGMAVKHAVEHWRRTMPRGMGTLYWQLNDCWPVASWSSLDYFGGWKALHHMASRFYAPLLISAVVDTDEGTVLVHGTSDNREDKPGQVRWEVTTLRGEVVAGGYESVALSPNTSTLLMTLDVKETIDRYGPRDLLLWLELSVDDAVVSENLALFSRPKHLSLPNPGIKWDIEELGPGRYQVVLSCSNPALWVWLETTENTIQLTDSFFHLRPDKTRTVGITLNSPEITQVDIRKSITVYSLFDTYEHGDE